MYIKKITILIILFYFLALLQTSFLVHFNILGKWISWSPSFIFILVVLWNLFEKSEHFLGVFNALAGGFFLDVFSSKIIGFNILILLAIVLFIKLVFKKYVRIPVIKKT